MSSKTNICNLALGHLGVEKEIGNLDTESSVEARSCRRYYDLVRDLVLRDFNWPFARTIIELDLIRENPNSKWGYEYRYPANAIRLIKILNSCNINLDAAQQLSTGSVNRSSQLVRQDSRQSIVSYEVAKDEDGQVIWTDRNRIELEYICRVEDVSEFPPDFEMSFSYLLAAHIAPRLTGGDPFQTRGTAFELYVRSLNMAKVNAYNEEQPDEEIQSEFIRSREGYFHDEEYDYKR